MDHTNFFTRSDGQRKCYFVAPGIASLLNCPRNGQRLKIVHTGSRCYERGAKAEDATYPCQYRVVQEGVESILPFMTKQLVTPSFEDVLGVLYRHAWAYKEMDREGLNKEFYRSLIAHKNGCMVFVLRGSEIAKHVTAFTVADDDVAAAASSGSGSAPIAPSRRSIPICIWKTPFSVSLMISQVEQASLLKLLDPEEKFMPADVRAKRDEKAKAEQAKIDERKAKQSAYAEKAKAALAATAAAAGKAAAAPAAAVSVAAPAAAPVAAAPASSEPAAAAESVQTKTEESLKMETS